MSDKIMARILQLAHERHTDSPDPLCPRCVEEWRTLRAQLAEANARIETLTRRLEAAEERAEAWEEAALGKEGKRHYDEMERSWRETVARAEEVETERNLLIEANEFIKGEAAEWRAERDELKRQLAADSKEHLETWKRLKQAEAELRRWRGCPSCKEDHDDSVMCPPHEVRTSGRAWFHIQARKWAERAEEAEAERDELKRKLDACQCETRVLNESMLIEAERERDQARAERDNLRVMFNDSQIVLRSASRRADDAETFRRQAKRERNQLAAEAVRLRDALSHWKCERCHGTKIQTDVAYRVGPCEECESSGVHPIARAALAATPLAAKAAERVKATADVVRATRELTANFESRTYRSPHHGDGWEAIKHEVQLREQLRKALDRLDALDKPEVQDKGGFMKRITVVCDRCGSSVDGLEEEGIGTSGFYRRPGWGQYMNEGENTICDACMQSDARYRAAQ